MTKLVRVQLSQHLRAMERDWLGQLSAVERPQAMRVNVSASVVY